MKSLENDQLNISLLHSALIAEELIRLGVQMVCIAPGSRSTPLVAACAKRAELTKVVCQDERSAGFFALGYARAKKIPAAVIVTSGSAVANLWPSVVEASNDQVPLILLTADRPPELRDVGSNQTIDQVKIFGTYARWFYDFPVPEAKTPLRYLLASVDEAVQKSLGPRPGPVHLNFMFREPFVPDFKEPWNLELLSPIKRWIENQQPLIQHLAPRVVADDETVAEIAKLLSASESGIIVAGAMHDEESEEAVLRFAEKFGWPILPDVLSGLRFRQSPAIAHHVDLALLDNELKSRRSDVVIQVGGRIVSKRLQQYLDANDALAYVIVNNHSDRIDPSCLATHRIVSEIAPFFRHCERSEEISAMGQNDAWVTSSRIVEKRLEGLDREESISEITVARSLLGALTDENFLFVGSSMPIRDVNMFAKAKARPVRLYCNRGASGIDGIVSTACGVSKALAKRGVLFCGDLTFLHDTNGLSLLKALDVPLVIVVVNNQGGGIFTMLDVQRQKEIFSPYFDAAHETGLSDLCQAYSLKHLSVQNANEWSQAIKEILNTKQHLVVEIVSDKWRNRDDHDAIREAISAGFNV